MRPDQWLRQRSELALREAAEEELARKYLRRGGPVRRRGPADLFWRNVFVPLYRQLPWKVRQNLMAAMPGSHRQTWKGVRSPKDRSE